MTKESSAATVAVSSPHSQHAPSTHHHSQRSQRGHQRPQSQCHQLTLNTHLQHTTTHSVHNRVISGHSRSVVTSLSTRTFNTPPLTVFTTESLAATVAVSSPHSQHAPSTHHHSQRSQQSHQRPQSQCRHLTLNTHLQHTITHSVHACSTSVQLPTSAEKRGTACICHYMACCGSTASVHTHTHTGLTALCPGLHGWAGTRKVKTIWILLKQETVSGSGISWAICKSAPCSRQIITPAPHRSVFYRPDALPVAQPTVSKH